MSGGISATTMLAAAAVATSAYTIYNGERQASMQKNSLQQSLQMAKSQQEAATKAQKDSEEAVNRSNQKRPDTMAILDAAVQGGKAGQGSTMLTGPQGIANSALQLGKNTLLGG